MIHALVLPINVAGLLFSIGSFRFIGGDPRVWKMLAAANFLGLVATLIMRVWPLVAVNAVCLLFALFMWWRLRRNKRRARALLSEKYRHVRDAMVRTLRDRRPPRPVLAPG